MKTKLLLLSAMLFAAFVLTGCDEIEAADELPDGDKTETPDIGDKDDDENDSENQGNAGTEWTDEDFARDIEDLFPDQIFCAYVLENFDTDNDGRISKEEAEAVTKIDVYDYDSSHGNPSKQIRSLEGIQYFTNLTYLRCNYNRITTLDVSNNTQLTELRCESNQFTTLDVSNNTQLTVLRCESNQLTTLDVSQNTQLNSLYCGSNRLTALDVRNNTQLTFLSCSYNQLTDLDVSQNTQLNSLLCRSNKLTDLDFRKNTKLENLYCSYNQLLTLDVSKNTQLTVLRCESNQLTTLDVSNNTQLTELSCYSNKLTTLDVSKTNLGNSTRSKPLNCALMASLNTLYLKTGWEIDGIYPKRDSSYVPSTTKILFKD